MVNVLKGCDDKKIRHSILGVEMGSLITERLKNIDELPPAPKTLSEVLHRLDDISTSAKTLEEIITQDPVLTAKILKIANSPYYGLSGEVNSISKAVVVLGIEEIRNLVIGLSVTSSFASDFTIKAFSANDLWLHSVGVGYCAKLLGERCGDLDKDELFTIGLIHDIGRFLMPLYFAEELEEAIALSEKEGIGLVDGEVRLGISHAEIGAFLATLWKFGDMVVTVIRYHHNPKGAGEYIRQACVIYVADQLVQKVGDGWDLDYRGGKLFVPKHLGLGANEIKAVARELKANIEKVRESWNQILD